MKEERVYLKGGGPKAGAVVSHFETSGGKQKNTKTVMRLRLQPLFGTGWGRGPVVGTGKKLGQRLVAPAHFMGGGRKAMTWDLFGVKVSNAKGGSDQP